jgi:hypothetical protein
MECNNCKSANTENSVFCCQCGEALLSSAVNPNQIAKKSLTLVLIMLAWEIFMNIIWLIIAKGLVPLLNHGNIYWDRCNVDIIYKASGWLFGLVSIALGVTFAILARHKAARGLLIAYTVVHFVAFLIYYVADLLRTLFS